MLIQTVPRHLATALLKTLFILIGIFLLNNLQACGNSNPNFINSNNTINEDTSSAPVSSEAEVIVLQRPIENRSIHGAGNNLENFNWGSTDTPFLRLAPAAYEDGIASMARSAGPNPRVLSNEVCDQPASIPDPRGLSAFVFQWGQFLDHDVVHAPSGNTEPAPIAVPLGDPFFDPQKTGTVSMTFSRTIFMEDTGTGIENPREQINTITAFIDASNIYGSDVEMANRLRSFSGGKLKTSEDNRLPFEHEVFSGFPESENFVSGDVRANEQVGLTALHTLFMREHNRLCDQLAEENPEWDDERIYQRARKIVGAQMQIITFFEFLPALLGNAAMEPYQGYNPSLNPGISNSFATAFFRVGHTMLPDSLLRLDETGTSIPEGPLSLAEAFFSPSLIIQEGGIAPLLRGLAAQANQQVDRHLVDGVRNFLFGIPGAGGLDLASLNIQRARDHALPDYNTLRQALGLDPIENFSQITSDPDLALTLETLYGSVDQIDPWVGALCENRLVNSSVGPTILSALLLQFDRLRHGDRFWYLNDQAFNEEDIAELEATRLSDIIRRNTEIQNIQDNVFFLDN